MLANSHIIKFPLAICARIRETSIPSKSSSTFYVVHSTLPPPCSYTSTEQTFCYTCSHHPHIYIVYTGAPVLSLLQHGVFVCENSEFMIKLVILSCQDFTAKCLLQNRCHNQSLPRDNFFRDKDNVSFSDKKVQQMLRTRYRNGFRQTEYIHYTIKKTIVHLKTG